MIRRAFMKRFYQSVSKTECLTILKAFCSVIPKTILYPQTKVYSRVNPAPFTLPIHLPFRFVNGEEKEADCVRFDFVRYSFFICASVPVHNRQTSFTRKSDEGGKRRGYEISFKMLSFLLHKNRKLVKLIFAWVCCFCR